MTSVRILNGPNRNQIYILKGGELVGRDPTNPIQVFAPGVSRKHFRFEVEGPRVYVQDLGSSNGTYVNNQKISKHLLCEADQITVGGINLLFSNDDNAPLPQTMANRPPPLNFSSEEVPLGAFGLSPGGGPGGGFGASPGPGPGGFGVTPAPVGVAADHNSTGVVMRDDDDEEEAAADYSIDASMVFSQSSMIKNNVEAEALQRRLSLLFEISQDMGSESSLEAMIEKMLVKLLDIFPQADRGFVLIGDRVEDLKPMAVRTRNNDTSDDAQMSTTIARLVMEKKQALLSQNAMEDDRFSGGMSIVNLRILSMACAPLLYRDEVFGLIELDTQSRSKFTHDDLTLLAGIAVQAAVFVKNLKLFENVAKEAEARANLQRYFSPALAAQIGDGEIDIKLGGDMKTGTVFFSDIIGFTSMSENMSPTDIVDKINRYMKYMVDIVFKYQGSVDKFIGDCIMAVWGAPVAVPDEAVCAVTAAVEMQNALFLFNGELYAEGDTPIHMGIGLNSGKFVAGNMGSERRMEYTVIGDDVNLAQRVESKAGRGMVLITESTYEKTNNRLLTCKLKPVALKGKSKEVITFSVRGIRQESSSGGKVFMTSLPCAIGGWREENCLRGLLVKVKILEPGKALGLVLFHERPEPVGPLELEFYAPEMPRHTLTFEAQGAVRIQAKHGCCIKGVFSYKDSALEDLFEKMTYMSANSPETVPRALTPA
ncbi:MAG: FHA domain-containing protein [Planctomycetes bacterium]|nr:FHA domain-containing protein [Planctomycetota bacterium]